MKHIIKKLCSLLITASLIPLAAMPTGVIAASNFVDTVGHWADEDIRAAVDYGYINGYPDGKFRPDDNVKRAEFVKIINSAMNYNGIGNIAFLDVPKNAWYYEEIQKAADVGYISGYDGGERFAPEDPINREETAMVLSRVSPGSGTTKAPKGLKDSADIGDWALQAVSISYSKGLLGGFPDGNFYPKRNLTRAEAVKIVNKLLSIDPASRAITDIELVESTDVRAFTKITSRIAGTLYWVVLNRNDDAPTALQVSQGKNSFGDGAMQKGSVKVTAFEAADVNISGLTPSTAYKLCAVVKGSDGKFSNVRDFRIDTVSQASMGKDWLYSFGVDKVFQNSATLRGGSDEKGTLYWVIMEDSPKTPSQTNIAAGNNADGDPAFKSGSMALSTDKAGTQEITGLKPGTRYSAYGFVSKSGTEFSIVRSASFTTLGINIPNISSFTASFNKADELQLSFSVNTSGKLYWIAVEESGGAAAPEAEKIKSGSANPNQTLADSGNVSVTQGAVTITKAALSASDPLKPNKKYRIYACVESASGGLSNVVYSGILEKSTVASGLTNLTVTAGGKNISLPFSQDKYDYDEITVPNGTKTVYFRPTVPSGADIILNGKIAVNNSNNALAMPADSGTLITAVMEISETGKNKKTYSIPIRENKPEVTEVYVSGSDPATPVKDSDGNYAVNVPDNYTEASVSISFAQEMTGSITIPVTGKVQVKNGEKRTVTLNDPVTTISMEVKGPSGDLKVYTLTITKAATP